jgi:hypothetical protein
MQPVCSLLNTEKMVCALGLIYFIPIYKIYLVVGDPAAPWLRTALTTDNSISIHGLDSGSNYLVVLVSTTGSGENSLETESDEIIIKTLGAGELTTF